MIPLASLGRSLFALGLIAFGVEQWVFGDFVVGRAPPWPASWPGGTAWACASGAFFIACGAAILFQWRARLAAVAFAVVVFLWAFLRQLPIALSDTHLGGEWTRLGKAVAFIGGALAIAGTSPRVAATVVNATDGFIRAG